MYTAYWKRQYFAETERLHKTTCAIKQYYDNVNKLNFQLRSAWLWIRLRITERRNDQEDVITASINVYRAARLSRLMSGLINVIFERDNGVTVALMIKGRLIFNLMQVSSYRLTVYDHFQTRGKQHRLRAR